MNNIYDGLIIRPIQESDNIATATLIRDVLSEHQANKPGTAFFDENLDQLHRTFIRPGSIYFVAEQNNTIIGSGGIYPTDGLPAGHCELVKLYLDKSTRGAGIGSKLIAACFAAAKQTGYTHMYLETMPELNKAIQLYERLGFKYLSKALGQSGHFSCNIWMLCDII